MIPNDPGNPTVECGSGLTPTHPQGFGSESYIHSLSEFGTPTQLPRSGGWFLTRRIPGFADSDALGSYPFFICQDWSGLAADLENGGQNLVSFSAMPDPFGDYSLESLQTCFPDVCIHFKDHHVADLTVPPDKIISKHHRQRADKALRQIDVEFCTEPLRYRDQWLALFDIAVQKFHITGIRAFSRESLTRQLAVPGLVMAIARHHGEIVTIGLFCVERNVAYAHLVASTEIGHKAGAFYALYFSGIHHFAGKVRWIDWGGEPGVSASSSGLGSFKSGWSTGTRPAYFCGRIFNRQRYSELTQAKGIAPTKYFPAYRQGEFG